MPRVLLEGSVDEYPRHTILCYDGYAIGFTKYGSLRWNYPTMALLTESEIDECMRYRYGFDWKKSRIEPEYDDIFFKRGVLEDTRQIQEDRELLLCQISWRCFDHLHKYYADTLSGMTGVSSYISGMVDGFLSGDVSKEAQKSGNTWDYYVDKFGTCMDWYYMDEAEKIILQQYPKL